MTCMTCMTRQTHPTRPPAVELRALAAAALLLLAGCASSGDKPGTTSSPKGIVADTKPRLFTGMGPHHRAVTTTNPQAQRYFDQGLTWAYAFNHDEAIRSFTEAARLDPQCAMAWWGVALCHGPHINNPVMPPERRTAAWDAVQKATALELHASPVERALIRALAARYAADTAADRAPLDKAYADAMVAVWKANPRDADVGALAAESLMDLQPWDLWTRDGQPKARTTEIVAALEDVMKLDADHPLALHLYIHAMEASRTPEKAVAAADRLRTLVPAAGHLVHMPAHIDVRVGEWDRASDANVRAAAADVTYRKLSPRQGFYHVYMAHNHHFLAYASMMEGRFKVAREAAKDMMEGVPPEFLETSAALVDPYTSIEFQVLVRFGKWDDVLAMKAPDARLPITTAMWRCARATALAAKGDVAGAEREQSLFREQVSKIPADSMMAINKAHDVLAIAERVLAGEIAFRKGKTDEAVASLADAAEREDNLTYMEPPEWIQPVRHSLGAILLAAGRGEEAAKVYQQDLERWPENGWALYGLAAAYEQLGKPDDAQRTTARFEKAWARADTRIGASCLCVK
jgi:tetratricopeptide (TPR) repeat protein